MRKDSDKKSLLVRSSRSDIVKFNNERAKKREGRLGFDFSYLFSALLTVAVAFLSVGLVVYFGYHLVDYFKTDVTYAPAYLVTEIEYRHGTGYIFREEEVIGSTASGDRERRESRYRRGYM